jgi:hypothetical protein
VILPSKATFQILQAKMIRKSGQEAERIVSTNASKVGIARVLLQENSEGHLRPRAYWPRKLKNAETRYNAYDKKALAIVEAVYRVWRMYLIDCKCFSMVTNHATLVHLLK